jgi:hypothetical protein
MNKVSTLCALAVAFLGISGSAFAQGFPRNVVIEEFTSATCEPCKKATPIINDAVKNNNGRVFSVRYHMNIPSPGDPWYAANASENDGRKTFYKVVPIPASRVNGLSATPTVEAEIVQRVNDGLAETSPVKLEVTQAMEGGKVNVTVKATASADEGISGMTLMAAAVEGLIHVEANPVIGGGYWNEEKDIHDVFRKMISGMGGTAIDLDAGQTKTYTFSYTPSDDWQLHQMYVVAFVQDPFDNTVIQAGASAKIASSVDALSGTAAGFSLGTAVPNPVRDAVAISYSLGSPEQVVIEVRDLAGALVATVDEGRREVGTFQARLDLRGVPSGVYAYTIRAGEYRETKMLTVVR